MTNSLRFAVVISHPTQHHAPFFRSLARTPGLDLKVFYCCDWGVKNYRDPGFGVEVAWDVDLLSEYESEFLPLAKRPADLGFLAVDNPEVGARLAAFAPDAIWLHGYGHRTVWRAASWARGRAALIHFGDSELLHRRSRAKELVRIPLLRWHFGRCDAFITIGDNNEAYYRHYGVPPEKMFRGAYPVDVSRFRAALADPARPTRADVRARWRVGSDDFVVVMLGKLEPRKRPLDLVDAVARLRRRGRRATALFVGDGVLREAVAARAAEAGFEDAARVTGFVNQREMPWVLAAADVLVTASDFDPHPLAVTEGMTVGLPVIASDKVGCVGPTDAARPGVNALVFPCGDAVALADQLEALLEDEALRARMSAASAEIASTQDKLVVVAATLRAVLAMGSRFQERWSRIDEEALRRMAAHLASLDDAAARPG